jgi:carbon-monoxide dehydrogenase medium subunit
MKPPAFSYHRPLSVDDALDMLATLDDPKLLAGGQSLMPMMNYRYVMPMSIIDLNRIPALSGIEERGEALVIGAMTRQRDLELSPVIRQRCPLLHEALLNVGHVQTRNRGTIGGSLSHLDPAAELPAALRALDAVLTVQSKRGTRQISIADWSMGFMTPNLEPDEMLTAITVPIWAKGHGVGTGPVRLSDAEAVLLGKTPDDAAIAAAAETAISVPGLDDVHASKEYRRKLAVVMTRRALLQARERAHG